MCIVFKKKIKLASYRISYYLCPYQICLSETGLERDRLCQYHHSPAEKNKKV